MDASVLLAAKSAPHAYSSHRTLVLSIGLGVGILVVLLAIPLLLKKVRPNPIYGLVSAIRLESRTKWYAANRYLGGALVVAGLITVVATVAIWVAKPGAFSKSNKLLAGVEL